MAPKAPQLAVNCCKHFHPACLWFEIQILFLAPLVFYQDFNSLFLTCTICTRVFPGEQLTCL